MSRLWDKRKCWSVIGFFPPINKNIALLINSGERAVWQRFRKELLYSSSILHSWRIFLEQGSMTIYRLWGGREGRRNRRILFFRHKIYLIFIPPLPGPVVYLGSPWFAVNFCNPPFLFCLRRLTCSPRKPCDRGDHLRPEPPAKFSDPPKG